MWFNRKFFIFQTLPRHSVLLPFSFSIFLFPLLISTETNRFHQITDYSQPPQLQTRHLPNALVKPIDHGNHTNSKTPIGILKSSHDLSKIKLNQFASNLDGSYFENKEFKHINDTMR